MRKSDLETQQTQVAWAEELSISDQAQAASLLHDLNELEKLKYMLSYALVDRDIKQRICQRDTALYDAFALAPITITWLLDQQYETFDDLVELVLALKARETT